MDLVLSCFPEIGLLDRAFEEEGFCVVRGPDLLWGGDVATFHPPAGRFDGVIGGPPCQAFSQANRIAASKEHTIALNLIPEFERIVGEARPDWFVMENVKDAPLPVIAGYIVRDVVLNNRWVAEAPAQNRVRRFSFGTPNGLPLHPEVCIFESPAFEPAVLASAEHSHQRKWLKAQGRNPRRTLDEYRAAQGLPADFLSHAPFTDEGKRKVIGNGVPLPLGRSIARAVRRALGEA